MHALAAVREKERDKTMVTYCLKSLTLTFSTVECASIVQVDWDAIIRKCSAPAIQGPEYFSAELFDLLTLLYIQASCGDTISLLSFSFFSIYRICSVCCFTDATKHHGFYGPPICSE